MLRFRMVASKIEFSFRKKVTEIWKTTFPKEFLNKI